MLRSFLNTKFAWWLIFVSCAAPFFWIVLGIVQNSLGPEPAKVLVDFFGETALMFLLGVLFVSPLQKSPFLKGVAKYRRMIGLYVFFYALCHVLSYCVFLVDWQNFVEDLYKRPYISVGFIAFVILFALGVTSPKLMVRKLGRSWKKLHRLIYLALALVLVHVFWQVRSDYTEAVIYLLFASILMWFRREYLLGLIGTLMPVISRK